MLYGGNNFDFTKLAELLKVIGLSESTADTFIRYMDEENADETLLDGIEPVKSKGLNTWEQRRIIWDVREKVFAKNSELNSRYINFIFTAFGMSGADMIFEGLFYNPLDQYRELRLNAIKRRFPDEAEAIVLALSAYYFYEESQRGGRFQADSPEQCLKAMEMLDKYGSGEPHLIAKAAICAAGLDLIRPHENKAETDFSPLVKSFCDKLKEIYDNAGKVTAEQYNLVAVGMAEAAFFSEEAKSIFKTMAEKDVLAIIAFTGNLNIDRKRIMTVVESIPEIIKPEYVHFIAEGHFSNTNERLSKLTKYDPKMMRTALDTEVDLKAAVMLQNIIDENDPDFDIKEYDLKGRVQRRAVRVLEAYSKDKCELIRDYINGKGSYADIAAIFKGYSKLNSFSNGKTDYDYYGAFGADDFFKRIFTINMIAGNESYYYNNNVQHNTGFDPLGNKDNESENIKMTLQFMLDSEAPFTDVISCMGSGIDRLYGDKPEHYARIIAKAAAKYPELLAECEPKNMSVMGRIIYAKALSEDTERFREQLVSVADDSSKLVRAEVTEIFRAHKELSDDVKCLLTAKKIAKRETAVSVIEAWGKEGFADELQKALDIEKNDKLKLRIAALIGSEGAAAAIQVNSEEKIKKLMKRVSRLDWLYSTPFAPVHKNDGTEADEDYIKAIMLCYVSMERLARNSFACELAEVLDKSEFELFAQEVFRRWFDKGAEAKTKWVLYFSAVHGGAVMCRELVRHINEWGKYSFNMRTAIVGEAVNALAMNGSSEALMNVDSIARKFKSKSVRAAANNAMAAAADGLGITAEELADRIVPDLGFDDDLCRVFDYGNRQFKVYIRPSLELEIFNGDKKVKSMPKPGVSDDAEKANAAYEQFKEMKKLMKTAVTAQKNRLEYVLMCDRKWSVEGWRTLFVKNAIMHCFAIGLIWGIYENGKLTTTFRYMEDGSFTTSDGDEIELPESAFIGLVHPIELSDELKDEWTEQLSDYEIEQPFPQLSRRVFTPEDKELELKRISRFKGSEIGSMSLIGKMTRLGWYKGEAEDAGFFYYFIREDVSSRTVAPDGSPVLTGYGALLRHSGTCIAYYDTEEDQITAEDLVFFKAGKSPNYWDEEEKGFIRCSEVPKRYFSEIMLQLVTVFGNKEEN